MKQPLVILAGPTAVGKTKASIRLAHEIGAEIISADSMQVYRHMDIGSAKITPEEMDGIPHYLVDVLEPEEEFNVVRFQQMAKDAADKIRAKGKIPLVVGGTGFYIQALLYDIDFTENDGDDTYRKELEQTAAVSSGETLDLTSTLDDINYQIIQIVLKEEHGNKEKTSQRLGISRSTLWRILKNRQDG